MSLSFHVAILVAGVVCTFGADRVAEDAPAARLTAKELRKALGLAQDRVKSLYVVYESDDYNDDILPKGYMLHRVVACQAPDKLFHWTSHGHAALAWQDDNGQQVAKIKDGVIRNEYPINRSYYEASLDLKKDGLPGTLPNEFLFGGVGLWYLPGIKPPRVDDTLPYVLAEVSQSGSYELVRRFLESVDGRWCHVLECPGRDTLWIDVDRGCALMARETIDPFSGYLGQRVELGGHIEVAPGIWFPKWIRNIRYDSGASDPGKRMRIWKDATHDILEVKINEIDESVFDWEPPAGALRVFDDSPSVQVVAGGLDHVEAVASWVKRTSKVSPPVGRGSRRRALFVGMICLMVLCAECMLWLKRNKHTTPTERSP